MARQVPPYLKVTQEKDPEFANIYGELIAKANAPGALDAKTKTLIIMAIGGALGHRDGVKNLAARARQQGASDAEIREALRLAVIVGGTPGLIAGTAAYE